MEPCKAAARQEAGRRCRHVKLGLTLLLLALAMAGLAKSLLCQAMTQASSMQLKAKAITLDASEDREHALIAVDAEVKEDAESRPHGMELRDAVCALRAGVGAALMLMHVKEVTYVQAGRVNFDMELEHDSLESAHNMLKASEWSLQVECDLGITVDLWRSGWRISLRHTVSFPLAGDHAAGFSADFVSQGSSFEPPCLQNLSASAETRLLVEIFMPQEKAERLLALLGDAQVLVRGGVTFEEQDLGAFEAHVATEGRLQHRKEGRHTVFALPVKVSGRADLLATGAAATATAFGERAEQLAGRHYHVKPYEDGRQQHSVTVVARKRCALAKALGARHVLSLRDDTGGPRLKDSLAQGRKLLERKLRGATLEGCSFEMHTRLFLDEAFAARVDLDLRGGSAAEPAAKLLAGVVLRIREDGTGNVEDWNYRTTGVAFSARASLDLEAPRVSVDLVQSIVLDSTRGDLCEQRWQCYAVWNEEGMTFDGPLLEHRVRNTTSWISFSLDWPVKAATFSGTVRNSKVSKIMRGLRNVAYNWTTANPSKDYDPFTMPWLQLPHQSRRLVDAAASVVARIHEHLPVLDDKVAGTARRLAANYHEFLYTDADTVSVSCIVDVDGTGVGGNVFDSAATMEVTFRRGIITAGLNLSIVEGARDNYTHSASASLKMPTSVSYSQVLSPSVPAAGEVDLGALDPNHKLNLGIDISAKARVVTDMSQAGKLKVHGSVNMLPRCDVESGQDAKLQTLAGLNATVTTKNPQCQKCERYSSMHQIRVQDGKHYLLDSCRQSQWSPPVSCCIVFDSTLTNLFGENGMTIMGSTWKETWKKTINEELKRPFQMTNISGWLDAINISLSLFPWINSAFVAAGSTTTRTWKYEKGEVVMKIVETPDIFAIIFSEEHPTQFPAFDGVPTASANGHLTFKKTSNGDGRTMDIQLMTGKPRKQMFAVAGTLTGMNSANNRYSAQLTVSNETAAILSGSLVLIDGPGVSGSVDLAVRNDTSQVSKFAMIVTDVKGSVQAVADVYGEPHDLLVKMTAGGMTKSGKLLQGQVSVKDKDSKTLIGAAATFMKDTASGHLDAKLESSDGNLANLTGSLPRYGTFFTGDLALTLDNRTQLVWMNASDGFVASGAKYGLPGFKRVMLSGGTLIEGEQANVSAYLEKPPFGDGLSGLGLACRVKEEKLDIDTSINLDLPFAKSGTGESGAVVEVVEQVLQEVTAEVVMEDVTSFNVKTFKEQLAKQAGMAVEIEGVDYKVAVTYNFAEAITEPQAITAVASAAGVSESQVSVTITNARRLLDVRRLQAINVEASIRTAIATAVAAIKTSVSDTTAVAAAVQTATGKAMAATVAVAPVTKVEVVTTMKADTAPVLTSAQLAIIGEAVGGKVQVTKKESIKRYTTRPGQHVGTASAASMVASHRIVLLLSMGVACVWTGNT